ncbi:putative FAD dependent oxidoreductase [Aspergillus clavatus NRRL 1]|uniref:Fumarate reductase n=1 Tax=Aspergillus clavatus (strain ATCC 1007 / CBS 513.65 / DSM 816 / NCTC 3887 / NRRL 1 / QM 1276 / 107) TaxID=344612 RepID=A1CDJ0_ASPCL|nr:FAD dependent oxidoreductase, putative [Aspergillus clavatus NRRL 1]EAW11917.1 FAD dependent oxidoreductase, putative [Aspergillus clavatus NRRL 1]
MTTSLISPLLSPPPVIIVGSGLAGLSAASQLLTHNIPVYMLDRAPKPGGNSIKASSGINGAPTRFQPASVPDSVATFLNDTIASAGVPLANATGADRARREQLLATLTANSAEAVYWLTEKGVDLSRVAQLGGHSWPRTHRGAGKEPPGSAIVRTLLGELRADPRFTLRSGARVTRVLRKADEVCGVEYVAEGNAEQAGSGSEGQTQPEAKTEVIEGPVIFASGGFAGDSRGLLEKYRPDLAGLPSTNEAREGSQPLLEGVGAALVDMEYVQVHPTGFVDPKNPEVIVKFLAAEMLRGEGGILLSGEGTRFVNELQTRQRVVDAIVASAERLDTATRQWDVTLVLDEGAAAAAGSHMEFYAWKGLMRKTTVGELGPRALQTMQDYAEVVSGKKKDPFGRTAFGHWKLAEVTPDSVVYAGKVTPVTHFTMGGVVIDAQSRVHNQEGQPIHGLWAAGEVTGGVHGQNRLGGSSLLECAVFGRIAGDQAAEFHDKHWKNE